MKNSKKTPKFLNTREFLKRLNQELKKLEMLEKITTKHSNPTDKHDGIIMDEALVNRPVKLSEEKKRAKKKEKIDIKEENLEQYGLDLEEYSYYKSIENDNIKKHYKIAIIDLIDIYHYADIFDEERYSWLGLMEYGKYVDYNVVVRLADRLFWALNPTAKTQGDWIEWEAGYDVRIYDKDFNCVYKAHEKLPNK